MGSPFGEVISLNPRLELELQNCQRRLKEYKWGGYPPEVLGQQEDSLETQLLRPTYIVVQVFHKLVAKEKDGGKNSSFS